MPNSSASVPPIRNLRNVVLFQDENGTSRQNSSPEMMALDKIVLPSSQPRRYFDPEAMSNLVASIRQQGILQPLLIRPVADQYELVAGERRYRAAKILQLNEIPVIIKKLTSIEAKLISLTENLQREDLNPVEETEGILTWLSLKLGIEQPDVISLLTRLDHEERGNIKKKVSFCSDKIEQSRSAHNIMGKAEIEELFQQLSLTWQSFLKNRLPLLNLPSDLLEILRQGKLAYSKARILAKVQDPNIRSSLTQEVIEQNLSVTVIREKLKTLIEKEPPSSSPRQRLTHTYKRLKQAQLWNDPQKWRKVEGLLNKLESLIEEK